MRAILAWGCLVVVGCSSSAQGGGGDAEAAGNSFATQLCNKVAACGETVTGCQASFAAIVLSASCQNTLLNASCADLTTSPTAADLQSCIPPCSGTNDTCNSDGTVTTCADGNTYVFTCDGICNTQSKTYTGTCAASYMGESAPNGQGCFCQ